MKEYELRNIIKEIITEIKNDLLYRSSSISYVKKLLTNKLIESDKKFTSFSKSENDISQFGDCLIIFYRERLEQYNELIEIEYDLDFFDNNPEIFQYVTGEKSIDDFIENNAPEIDNNDIYDVFENFISTYKDEQEVIGPRLLKYDLKCIKKIIVPIEYKKIIDDIQIAIKNDFNQDPAQIDLFNLQNIIIYR